MKNCKYCNEPVRWQNQDGRPALFGMDGDPHTPTVCKALARELQTRMATKRAQKHVAKLQATTPVVRPMPCDLQTKDTTALDSEARRISGLVPW